MYETYHICHICYIYLANKSTFLLCFIVKKIWQIVHTKWWWNGVFYAFWSQLESTQCLKVINKLSHLKSILILHTIPKILILSKIKWKGNFLVLFKSKSEFLTWSKKNTEKNLLGRLTFDRLGWVDFYTYQKFKVSFLKTKSTFWTKSGLLT